MNDAFKKFKKCSRCLLFPCPFTRSTRDIETENTDKNNWAKLQLFFEKKNTVMLDDLACHPFMHISTHSFFEPTMKFDAFFCYTNAYSLQCLLIKHINFRK